MNSGSSPVAGRLRPQAIQTSLIEQTIEFIWGCMLPWRDDPERRPEEGEEELNGFLADFLTVKARSDFPMVFFRHEQRQEGQRRVDIAAKPTERTVIEGVNYTKYDPILVLEGKRLPAPSKSREREYVTGGDKLSGGIQRFKQGLHGRRHATAIIMGYLQQGQPDEWQCRINQWISELSNEEPNAWSEQEHLNSSCSDSGVRFRAVSVHPRVKECGISDIRILHFWVRMNGTDIPPKKVTSRKRGNAD